MRKLHQLVLLITSGFFLHACSTLKVPIDNNKLVTNCTIDFVSNNIKIQANQSFKLSELGLIANRTAGTGARVTFLTDVNKALKAFKKGKFKNYDILINNPKYPKPYYGKIAFFNTSKKNQTNAVARYREISIDDTYFQNAIRGRTAIMYEYAQKYQLGISELKVPTWVILMSDEPF